MLQPTNATTCSKCQKQCVKKRRLNEGENFGAPCDSCSLIYCRECAKLSTTETDAIALQGNRTLLFFCSQCKGKTDIFLGGTTEKNSDELKKENKVLKEKIASLEKAITTKEQKVQTLEKELRKQGNLQKNIESILEERFGVILQTMMDNIKSELKKQKEVLSLDIRANIKDAAASSSAQINKLSTQLTHMKETNIEMLQMYSGKNKAENLTSANTDKIADKQRQPKQIQEPILEPNEKKDNGRKGRICSGPQRESLKIANPNIIKYQKLKFIYISNLDVNTTPENITDLLDPKSKDLYVCEKLRSRFKNPRSAAFKLGVPEELEVQYLSPDFWPSGCYVATFAQKTQQQNARNQQYNPNQTFRSRYYHWQRR